MYRQIHALLIYQTFICKYSQEIAAAVTMVKVPTDRRFVLVQSIIYLHKFYKSCGFGVEQTSTTSLGFHALTTL